LLAQFGLGDSPAVHYAIAFAIIFVLLTLFALVLRRLTGGRSMLSGPGGRTRQPRLGIVDVYDLDRQRQLILLRRDNVEHLLLIGGPNDVVIETNIVRVPGLRVQAAPEHGAERAEASLPEALPGRPVVEALPLRAVAEGGERGRGNVTALQTETTAVTASMPPNPTRAETVLKPDVVALQGGRAAPRRAEAPPPRPPTPPAPPETPRRSGPIPPARSEPQPAPAPKPADAAVLSDMAKQLEEALKRPAAPKPPEPVPAPPPPPPARTEAPPPPPPARPPAPPPPPPPPPAPPPRAAAAEPPKPPPPPRPTPAPPIAAPVPPGAAPAAEAPAAPRAEPPAPKPEPAAATPTRVSDPFSVEEIEAEFARLLGRPFDQNDKGDKA
jgi:flagellar protein FliO/FliZ